MKFKTKRNEIKKVFNLPEKIAFNHFISFHFLFSFEKFSFFTNKFKLKLQKNNVNDTEEKKSMCVCMTLLSIHQLVYIRKNAKKTLLCVCVN